MNTICSAANTANHAWKDALALHRLPLHCIALVGSSYGWIDRAACEEMDGSDSDPTGRHRGRQLQRQRQRQRHPPAGGGSWPSNWKLARMDETWHARPSPARPVCLACLVNGDWLRLRRPGRPVTSGAGPSVSSSGPRPRGLKVGPSPGPLLSAEGEREGRDETAVGWAGSGRFVSAK